MWQYLYRLYLYGSILKTIGSVILAIIQYLGTYNICTLCVYWDRSYYYYYLTYIGKTIRFIVYIIVKHNNIELIHAASPNLAYNKTRMVHTVPIPTK